MSEEKDMCSTLEGLFQILTNKFRPHFNETIISLQLCKLSRQDGENVEECMGRLQISAIECNYPELDKIKTAIDTCFEWHWYAKGNNLGTHKNKGKWNFHEWKCIGLGKESQVAKSQTSSYEQSDWRKGIWKNRSVEKKTHKDSPNRHTQTKMPMKQTCRYCHCSHPLRQYLTYGKTCTECGKIGHFRVVGRSRRTRAMHEVEKETVLDNDWEPYMTGTI